MPTLAALYLLSYVVFSYATKQLGKEVGATALLLASVVACAGVWFGLLLAQHGLAALGRRVVFVGKVVGASWLARVLPRLSERDVIVVALASAGILLSSTLAYSRPDVSLLLPLVLMKGGVILWGPVVSFVRGEEGALSRRAVGVLGLTVAALGVILWPKVDGRAAVGVGVAAACAAAYVVLYYPKIATMRRHLRDAAFLPTEMTLTVLVALPVALVADVLGRTHEALGGLQGLAGAYPLARVLGGAFLASWTQLEALLRDPRLLTQALGSEGAALFGGLLFMAPAAASVCVPLNRCASLLGGSIATLILWTDKGGRVAAFFSERGNWPEIFGALLMCAALWVGMSRPAVPARAA